MARIRTIKPDFWRDDSLSTVSAEAALLAIGLLNHSDDEGYFQANPKLIEADVFPLRELSSSTPALLQELVEIGYIQLFLGSDGKSYGHVISFSKHQVISKPTASKISGLRSFQDDSGSSIGVLHVGKERNGIGKADSVVDETTKDSSPTSNSSDKKTTPRGTRLPTDWTPSDALMSWAKGARPDVNLESTVESFRDYWFGKAGKDGAKLDWDATFRNWVRNQRSVPGAVTQQAQSGASVVDLYKASRGYA